MSGGLPLDHFGAAIGRDFLNTWMGGRSAFCGGPAPWFDFQAYNTTLRANHRPSGLSGSFLVLPAASLLFIWPLGLLPYLPAYALWCVLGLALYLARRGRAASTPQAHAVPGGGAAVAVNVFFGQNGFLTAALLDRRAANLDRRPTRFRNPVRHSHHQAAIRLVAAGVLVLTGRWRVIAAAVATMAVLVAVTSVWFGPDIWLEYVRKVTPQQHWLLTKGGGLVVPMVASAFVNARHRSGCRSMPTGRSRQSSSASALGDGGLDISGAGAIRFSSLALFVTAMFLFSPWMLNYDMVVFGWVIALLRERTTTRSPTIGWRLRYGRCRCHAAVWSGSTSRSRCWCCRPSPAGCIWRLSPRRSAARRSGDGSASVLRGAAAARSRQSAALIGIPVLRPDDGPPI